MPFQLDLLSAALRAVRFAPPSAHAQPVQGFYIGAGFSDSNRQAGGHLRRNKTGGFAGEASVG